MIIKPITDPSFQTYGCVMKTIALDDIAQRMAQTPLPDGVVYEPSVSLLEAWSGTASLQRQVFGELAIQLGYCNGHNTMLDALEYHASSEVNIAITDMILLLGRRQDITMEGLYDTRLVEAFYVPAGSVIELYATTLHYAPCQCSEEGFRCVVVLPKDTNTPLKVVESTEATSLYAVNKWLYAHPEGGLEERAHIGLCGDRIDIAKG